jgi:predicted GNAT superfamily acetyltransferase
LTKQLKRMESEFNIAEHVGSPNEEVQNEIFELYRAIFNSEPNDEARERLSISRDILTLLAYNNNLPVGFKVGYRQDPDTFYSWLGGVLPEFRGNGLASQLMNRQHNWARSMGYKFIQTKTLNRWREMLILNLRNGFNITGTYVGKDGRLRLILEKSLE